MTISAKIIADSTSEAGKRLTTLQLRYPKFIHGELMTHRAFSRNASSSRAIPVERLIRDVLDDPVYPSYWGANQRGMQAAEECNADVFPVGKYRVPGNGVNRKLAWDNARRDAVDMAIAFADVGYHKQIVNRLLEPFCHINVVITATEWDNFFALRCHPDAQPEMRELAEKMRDAVNLSWPRSLGPTDWHLPYVDIAQNGWSDPDDLRPVKMSVARCARVSYFTQEGKAPTVKEDLALYDRLVGARPIHASPAEHQATPDVRRKRWRDSGPQWREESALDYASNFSGTNPYADRAWNWERPHLHGNLVGWCQYRKMIEEELR